MERLTTHLHLLCRHLNSLTAGKLHAVVGPPRTVQGSGSYGPNFTRWLTKHAKLLHSLRVHGPKPEEDDITPGLLAAGAAGAESASASATSTSVAPQHPSNVPDLPLQSLTCYAPCAGSIFHGLSSAHQLTSLTLRINLAEPWMEIERFSACSDALGALTSLRHLTLGADSIYGTHPLHQHNFGILYHAWHRLTALTNLDLDPDMATVERACRGRWFAPVLEADVVKAFPPSLVALRLSRSDPSWREQQEWVSGFNDAWDLGHLTSLSALSFRHLTEGTVLPAGLSVLRLADCHSVEPLAAEKLKHLKVLRSMGFSLGEGDNVDGLLEVLHGLREVPAFQQLHLDLQAGYSTCSELDRVFKALVGVPLVGLAVNVSYSMPEQVVSNLGALTRLMGLSLAADGWQAPAVTQLASALRQHRTLQRLHISNTSRQQGVPQAETSQQQWLQVCQALCGVIGLRHVSFEACALGDAAAELAGLATQLTRLSLVRCGVTHTGLMVLGSALKHLLPYNLLVDDRPLPEPGCVIA